MGPFETLGLSPDADEGSIKRAYARLLKSNRPDDDAAAFQRINEAYQAALDIARRRTPAPARTTDASTTAPPASTIDEAPVATADVSPIAKPPPPSDRAEPAPVRARDDDVRIEVPAPRFEFAAFLQAVTRLCREDSPRSLSQWLNAQLPLYSIELKASVGDALHRHWRRQREPLTPGHADILSRFFERDFASVSDAQTGPNLVDLARAVADERMPVLGESDRARKPLRQLKRPVRGWQLLVALANPGLAASVVLLARRLEQRHRGLPPGINPAQVAFFERLVNPGYFGLWRWLALASRSLVAAVGLGGGATALLALGAIKFTGAVPDGLVPIMVALTVMLLAFLWLREAMSWVRWNEQRPEPGPRRFALWLPTLLAAVAFALSLLPPFPHALAFLVISFAVGCVARTRSLLIQCVLLTFGIGVLLVEPLGNVLAGEQFLLLSVGAALTVRRVIDLLLARRRRPTPARAAR